MLIHTCNTIPTPHPAVSQDSTALVMRVMGSEEGGNAGKWGGLYYTTDKATNPLNNWIFGNYTIRFLSLSKHNIILDVQ
jgi:hypothetical protein